MKFYLLLYLRNDILLLLLEKAFAYQMKIFSLNFHLFPRPRSRPPNTGKQKTKTCIKLFFSYMKPLKKTKSVLHFPKMSTHPYFNKNFSLSYFQRVSLLPWHTIK